MKPPADDATPVYGGLQQRLNDLAYRLLLAFPVRDGLPPMLLFTSARTGEGKTTIATAVAQSMARLAGVHVLLADANMHRPALAERFGLAAGTAGVCDAIRGDLSNFAPLADASGEGAVQILPIGNRPDPALLFRSEAIARLRSLARGARCVVFDGGTAQLGGGSLGQSVDGVVVVIDASSTRREVAKGNVDAMRLPPGRVVGAVLNKRPRHIPQLFYKSL